ncbi:MAG TPA: hypothetical protein VF997_22940, partial [Polyangia bacterium]
MAGAFALVAAAIPGCNCAHNGGRNNDGGNGDSGVPTVGSITIDPSDVTLDLVQGQPAPTQAFKVTYHPTSGDKDVTSSCTYTLGDNTMGTMNGNVFTAGMAHGGTVQLVATY